jgi:D-alanyl-lipoteichoic acid acyltransferase DltB (MBOAT superfamily)
MTLSRFLRDYLYIPLGGDRGGRWRVAASVMITMRLGGLRHGASWSFMAWGGLHGLFLLVNRAWAASGLHDRLAALDGAPAALRRWVSVALTFNAVCRAWCFFRLARFEDSLACVRKCVVFDADRAFAGEIDDPAL